MAIQCMDLLYVALFELLLTEMNNTATKGSATSRIPYGD